MRDGEPLLSRVVTVTGGGIRTTAERRDADRHADRGARRAVRRLHRRRGALDRRRQHDGLRAARRRDADRQSEQLHHRAPPKSRCASIPTEWPCIRCGDCAIVCPPRLLPQELLVAATTADFDALHDLGLQDCIECGCCDVVCPSHISLTERFRQAKRSLALRDRQQQLAAESGQRFERRERRIENERGRSASLIDRLKGEAADPDARDAAIRAALERAKQRRDKAPESSERCGSKSPRPPTRARSSACRSSCAECSTRSCPRRSATRGSSVTGSSSISRSRPSPRC